MMFATIVSIMLLWVSACLFIIAGAASEAYARGERGSNRPMLMWSSIIGTLFAAGALAVARGF